MEVNTGDQITIIGHNLTSYGPLRILKVTRCLKKFFELEDGTRWMYTGHPYPRKAYAGRYYNPCAEHTTQDHINHLQFYNNIRLIQNWIKKATIRHHIDQLNKIAEIIKNTKDYDNR